MELLTNEMVGFSSLHLFFVHILGPTLLGHLGVHMGSSDAGYEWVPRQWFMLCYMFLLCAISFSFVPVVVGLY